MQVNEIINNYFQLTGRPISTMTVEEYLTFLKQGNINIQMENISQGTSQAAHIQSEKEDTIQETATEKSTAISDFKQAKDSYSEKKSVSEKADALTLLRSVKG